MQMGMMDQSLAPGVENGEEADLGAQMLGVGSDGLKSFGGSAEENAVDGFLVVESDGGNLFRQGEDCNAPRS